MAFIIATLKIKKTRYGDPFLNLSLSDSSGNINAKIWDNADYYNSKFDEGDIVCVKGDTDIYRSKLVLNVSHISRFEDDDIWLMALTPNTLISELEVDVKSLWNEVTAYFSKTEKCKGLIKSICKDYKRIFKLSIFNGIAISNRKILYLYNL